MPSYRKCLIPTAFAAFFSICIAQQKPLYKDPAAPLDKRVADLVSRMTLEEKISQLMNDSAAIDRLDVPAYNWWNECLHGVARAGRATVYPETIGMAATWDAALLQRVSTAISDEARAKYHEFLRRGKHNIYQGLTFWTPNINLFRDPRWGRGMETYGEDPYLTGHMATAFIKGLEGDDPKYLKTIATAKHYAVHSGPESLRHTFDAVIPEQELRESYLPHFETAIREGGAQSVMCAYNRVDGLPACASPKLLNDILRKQWGFTGYVVSDCGAIGDIYLNHKTAPNAAAGVAAALKAGTDLNCGVEYVNLLEAVKGGLLAESDINQALGRLLAARFKLGMFDPPEMVKYAQIPYSVNDSPAHSELAAETARKSIVLLKNENRSLPLKKSIRNVAVIGPNADDPEVLLGNYNGEPTAPVTPLEGIRRKLGPGARVQYARGTDLAPNMPAFQVVPSSALSTTLQGGEPGMFGEYYNTSNFDGKAHRPRELTYPTSGKMAGDIPRDPHPLFTRIDPKIDFHWWDGAPRADMHDDDFGIRWNGFLTPPVTGDYQLGAIGMNAFELYLDGKPFLDFSNIHGRRYRYEAVHLEAGRHYPIRLDFHEFVNDADIQLVWSPPRVNRTDEIANVLTEADAVIVVLGLSPRLEGEEMKVPVEGFSGGDRVDLGIPRVQEELLERVVSSAPVGTPVILVLVNGSALSINWPHEHVPAIVELWYPGQGGGTALADVLFGDYNPAGRLPVTFYTGANQLPAFTDYSMKGRTYRFFQGEPLYPFGFGLSYTSFAYRGLTLPKQSNAGEPIQITVQVVNTGKVAGDEVVELYSKELGAPADAPIRSLIGFQRVALKPGEKKTVRFDVAARDLASVGKDGHAVARPGVFEITAGGKQPGFHGPADAATTGVITGRLQLWGNPKVLD
ncbi:MAG TPA: glycoside hydrolase family 3 C-terminal domain-containing protein [Bryobacteraceae bacterium]|nr:glycoside hydrolase family 3 C-terminal domain-containing protein [Bryobacteraceae bacterium]